jgi:hypothetical protein
MVEIVVPVALFLSLAFAMIGVTKAISDGRTRRRLLETNAPAELAAALVSRPQGDIAFGDALKWGLVTGAVGLGLIIVQFLPYDADDPIVSGLVLVFGAIGLLGYYATARRLSQGTDHVLGRGAEVHRLE